MTQPAPMDQGRPLRWIKGTAYETESTDGRWGISHEQVPLSCAGPHPTRGDGYCWGDEMHYSWRWLLIDRKDRSIEVCDTKREAQSRAF